MILHILKKDVRRLWPAILASLVVLGSLAWHDRWRSDWQPGAAEGYLNLLMPVVWAFLLGLAVEQEPIAGDRQFWLTRPYGRSGLLTAKLLFAVLFVHVPSMIADCYILASRGFQPLAYAPELFTKQALLAGALTLPAIAAASLVRSFAHYVLEVVAIAGVLLLLSGSLWGDPYRSFYILWEPFADVRRDVVIFLAALAGTGILALQYFGRRVPWARALAATAGLTGIAVFVWFLPRAALAIRTMTNAAPATPGLHLDTGAREPLRIGGRPADILIALPVAFSGVPAGTALRLFPIESTLEGGGARHTFTNSVTYDPQESRPYRLSIPWRGWDESAPRWLILSIDRTAFARFQDTPVTIRGEAAATLTRNGDSVWMGVGERRVVPGAGRCASEIVEDRTAERIKLECESPRENPTQTRVRLWSPETGRDWKEMLGSSRTVFNGPRVLWLSPLYRDQTFWNLGTDPRWPGDQWLVPAGVARTVRIEIIPQTALGYSAVHFEFRDLDLRRFIVKASTPGAVLRTIRR